MKRFFAFHDLNNAANWGGDQPWQLIDEHGICFGAHICSSRTYGVPDLRRHLEGKIERDEYLNDDGSEPVEGKDFEIVEVPEGCMPTVQVTGWDPVEE